MQSRIWSFLPLCFFGLLEDFSGVSWDGGDGEGQRDLSPWL